MAKYRVLARDKKSKTRKFFANVDAKSPKEAITIAKNLISPKLARLYVDWQAKKYVSFRKSKLRGYTVLGGLSGELRRSMYLGIGKRKKGWFTYKRRRYRL